MASATRSKKRVTSRKPKAARSSSKATQAFKDAHVDPETNKSLPPTTSDAATRKAGVLASDVPPDLGENPKSSDSGPEKYPFPPQGDVDVASVDPGDGKNEHFAALNVDDWVVLDGSHKDVPDRLDGHRAIILDAPREATPWDERDEIELTVRTRDAENATLHIPFAAVKSVQRGGLDPTIRG